ncbi:MAG: repeat protein [Planctomycetaceae bacterium]|nr:repeat protein [Planctomycetaceae bacterium]
MQIQEQARKSRDYDSGSPSGLVVDQLIPQLNPDQLVEHARRLLLSTSRPDPMNYSYNNVRFSTQHDNDSRAGDEVGLWPIAQAVWRLDQKLDAESRNEAEDVAHTDEEIRELGLAAAIHPDRDNLVERRITPVLMQLSYLNPSRLEYAAILGGSAYERFLLRNDWRRPADRSGMSPHVGDYQNYVNPWFYKLIWLRTHFGTAFRRNQSQEVMMIAHNGLSEFVLSSGSLSTDFDFLFLDREFSKDHPSLAMKFWPDLDRLVRSSPRDAQQQMLKMRWDYLGRLWPESRLEDFIDAFREAVSAKDYLFIPELPVVLTVESQFEIFQGVLRSEIDRVALLPADPKSGQFDGPKHRGEQTIQELKNKLYLLSCESAARQLLSDLVADPKHPWWSRLHGFLAYDTRHDDLLRLIAQSDQPKLQLMILPAIEHHPTPNRQQFLEQLLKAKDEQVRVAATAVKRTLKELDQRRQPLRTIPDLGSAQ